MRQFWESRSFSSTKFWQFGKKIENKASIHNKFGSAVASDWAYTPAHSSHWCIHLPSTGEPSRFAPWKSLLNVAAIYQKITSSSLPIVKLSSVTSIGNGDCTIGRSPFPWLTPGVDFVKQFTPYAWNLRSALIIFAQIYCDLTSCICALRSTDSFFSQIWVRSTLYALRPIRPTFMKSTPVFVF
jgi:hypothetical protein